MICAAPNDTTIVAFPEDDAGDVLTNSICDRGTPVLFDRACASASNVVLPLTTICSTVGALVVAGAMLVRGGELVVTTAAVDGPAFSPEGACVVGSSAVAFPAAGVAVVLRSPDPDPDPAALVIGGSVVVVDGILDVSLLVVVLSGARLVLGKGTALAGEAVVSACGAPEKG